jgi:hypothetical protein
MSQYTIIAAPIPIIRRARHAERADWRHRSNSPPDDDEDRDQSGLASLDGRKASPIRDRWAGPREHRPERAASVTPISRSRPSAINSGVLPEGPPSWLENVSGSPKLSVGNLPIAETVKTMARHANDHTRSVIQGRWLSSDVLGRHRGVSANTDD